MQKVKVKTNILLNKLRENKEKHIKEYNEASKNWKIKTTEALKKFHQESLQRLESSDRIEYIHFSCPVKPISHETDYILAIEMLEFSVDQELELTQQEFKTYVQDEWNWKHEFTTVNSAYTTTNDKFYSGLINHDNP
jgi:hypothetical protein